MKRTALGILVLVLLFFFSEAASAADSPLPNIKILATGGTIAGTAPSNTQMTEYARGVIGVQTLIDAVPEIKQYANVSGEQITNVASPSLTFPIWLQMAKRINELLASKDVDGVVITHGTSPWKKPLTSSTSCSRARNPSCWWGQCVRQLPSAPTVR